MWPGTSGPDDGTMHNWYYNHQIGPGDLASLSSRQRSERAAWRSAIRQALSNRSASEPEPVRAKRTKPPAPDTPIGAPVATAPVPREPVLSAC